MEQTVVGGRCNRLIQRGLEIVRRGRGFVFGLGFLRMEGIAVRVEFYDRSVVLHHIGEVESIVGNRLVRLFLVVLRSKGFGLLFRLLVLGLLGQHGFGLVVIEVFLLDFGFRLFFGFFDLLLDVAEVEIVLVGRLVLGFVVGLGFGRCRGGRVAFIVLRNDPPNRREDFLHRRFLVCPRIAHCCSDTGW